MKYCPDNITLTDVWVNNGTSQCFMDTVSSSVLAIYLAIFGTAQLWMYSQYGSPNALSSLSKSKLYYLQIFLTYFLSILAVVRFVVHIYLLNHGIIYGYMIFSTVLYVLIFPYSAYIVSTERHNMLPAAPSRGHGLVLLIFWTLLFVGENLTLVNLKRDDWWFHMNIFKSKVEMVMFVSRYISCLFIFVLGLKAPGIMTSRDYFGLSNSSSRNTNPENERLVNGHTSTWHNLYSKVCTLAPFLWPKKSMNLQFRVFLCFILIGAGRAINVLTPVLMKEIVDSISFVPATFRWDLILIYVGFKYLQGGGTGGMGLLNNLRSFIWIRVQQYTTREVKLELFRHLHSLSLRWHLSRKTGEVLRVMDRGTDSINTLLSLSLYQILPTFLDITVAIVFFISAFNWWFGLIVFVTMFLYLAGTIAITEWRTKFQRRMNLADNKAKAQSVDSILNFETVKYYGAEEYEVDQYRQAVVNYQDEEFKNLLTLCILNSVQNVIICGGLLAGSLLCVYLVVTENSLTVGDYVLFSSYIIQLYVPLNWFGTFYRQMQNNFVDMENMFDLLSENAEVQDAPAALPIQITKGVIEFRNVSFSYVPERMVIRNISFTVPPGKTVALVGPSGSGKSTIIRLLFRFYDVSSGSIYIDGQDIKTVTQQSLRKSIGVVPQDTVLFNKSIEYNIRYGKIDASDPEVVSAAVGADIHEKILSFPEAYDTPVGERGLKLSGGEKQRVAIARTILKSPMIVLLDEATSALDTQTERNIQAALSRICANKSTIIVAHRLSTIIHADEILVIKDGEICERGTHQDLIFGGGLYAAMWQQQLENDSVGTLSTEEK